MPLPSKLLHVAVGAGDHEVQDQRKAEREQEEAPVAQRAQQLVAHVQRAASAPAPAHSPRPRSRGGCRSLATVAGQREERLLQARGRDLDVARVRIARASSARIAASESAQCRTTASPRRSALLTPGSACERSDLHAWQRRADRARADHRPDLGRRPVGDDRRRAPSARRGRHTRRPPRGSAWRTRSSCRARRTARIVVQKRAAALDVQRDRRLVEHEQLGVADERDREAHALGLPAGQLLRALARRSRLRRSARAPHRRPAARGTARPSSPPARAPTGPGSAAPVCSIPPTAPSATACAGGAAEHRHRARVGREQAEQHVDRRRLARAVGAEQRDRLARRDSHVDAAHRPDRPVGAVEGLDQPAQLDLAPPCACAVVRPRPSLALRPRLTCAPF